jgi:hypothetical protein
MRQSGICGNSVYGLFEQTIKGLLKSGLSSFPKALKPLQTAGYGSRKSLGHLKVDRVKY